MIEISAVCHQHEATLGIAAVLLGDVLHLPSVA
jgi:hypothetical protein